MGVIPGVEQRERGLRNPLFHSSGVTTAKASHSSHDHLKRLQMKYPESEQLTYKVNPARVSKPLTQTAKILRYSFLLDRAESGQGKNEPTKVRLKKGRLPAHCNRKSNVLTH